MHRKKNYDKTLLGAINQNYVYVSNNMTEIYTQRYGFYCDLYFPRHKENPDSKGEYIRENIFEPHEMPFYNADPDVKHVKFYIPYLLKKENMNSPDLEFDPMYIEETDERPFIETTKKDELPIMTKVVVYVGQSVMRFFVDLKRVVNGASGHMLLRMYLAPVLEGNYEE